MLRRWLTGSGRGKIAAIFALVVLVGVVLLLTRGPKPASSGNLLAGLAPVRVSRVHARQCLTDGIAADPEGPWNGDLSARFASRSSFVVYDLKRPVRIRRVFLQADGDDSYDLAISDDGVQFAPIWSSGRAAGSGLQDRSTVLDASGRFLRLSASGGDGSYGVSEVQVFDQTAREWPPRLPRKTAIFPAEVVRTKVALFGMALMVFAAFAHARLKAFFIAALALIPLIAGIDLAVALDWAWPPGAREVAAFRGAMAAVAVMVVARAGFARTERPPHKTVTALTLAVCAGVSIACFYNLGHPQFWDHQRQRPGFIHNVDMRVYFPVAKYFRELEYDGVYVASVAAATEDVPSPSLEAQSKIEFRDLRTNIMTNAAHSAAEVALIKQRFLPQRWQEFKRDMRYFREAMGPDYFGTLSDHGGNATPVWLAIAHGLFAWMPASHTTLLATALLDPLLMLVAFAAIARTFGIRPMLLSMVVFGATDLYMFGTNWAGATLRHDWLAYLALGVCALRSDRFVLAGALLALAGFIRAFPALALLGAGFPVLWWLFERVHATQRLPHWRELATEQRWFGRLLLGVAASSLIAGVVSTLVLSPAAWSGWLQKMALISDVPHVNDVSLRALVTGVDTVHARMLETRWPMFFGAALGCLLLVFLAARGRRPEQGAILGLLLVPVVFAPANYYLHLVFLLPLLAVENPRAPKPGTPEGKLGRPQALIWLFSLGMCAAQYFTVLVTDARLHFYYASLLYFAMTVGVLVTLITSPLAAPEGRHWESPSKNRPDSAPS
jgi:hypothetical protein